MIAPRLRGALSLGVLLALVACGGGGGTEPSKPTPSAVDIVSGNNQVGFVGSPLSSPLIVKVSSNGAPLSGVTVTFAVTSGAASVSPASATTDVNGQASTTVTLGASSGSVQVTATVAGTSLTTTFTETAGSSSTSLACQTSSATLPAVGAVNAGLSGTGICLGGGTTGADYALIPFNANPDSSAIATLTVTGTGTVALSSPNIAPSFNVVPGATLASARPNYLQQSFDRKLREVAREVLTPMIPVARARLARRAAYNVIPANLALGQIISVNANGQDACTNAINVGARVAAITQTAIILADTANPSGGFSDAEYNSFGVTFDTLINPLDVQNFGQPSDIDKNGKIVILFTKEVNKLTPKTGGTGVIGGFFFERDLFPTSDTPDLQGCPTSNYSEMFYTLVPDTGGVFSLKHNKTDVLNLTYGTLAHEYQHLINASRRIYVNNASDFEDVWLNEGLSHIAEELLYYRVSGTAPRENIGIQTIAATQASVDAFNNYQADNFGRYDFFLGKPNQTSVYAGNDSLETRGATWDLLRYLADHRTGTSSDADTWSKLVNSTTTGKNNLAQVFGTDYMTQIRNWAVSVFTDDLPSVSDPAFQEPSWNMREIFPRLRGTNSSFPLKVVPLSAQTPVSSLQVDAGGAAYIRFTVPAGGQSSIDWTGGGGLPVSSTVQFTLVRTR
ncbi:MAG TPA: Ig-like domain-containing protein [Gemmatimonadaceae bacterium]|nr:Ig-like domain-containing protein [Gemmatimonadaceae bacterium]